MKVGKEVEHWRGRRAAIVSTRTMMENERDAIVVGRSYHEEYLEGEKAAVEVIISDVRAGAARDGSVALAVDLRTDAREKVERLERQCSDLGWPMDPAQDTADQQRAKGWAAGQLAILREFVGRLDRWAKGDVSLASGGAPERSDLA